MQQLTENDLITYDFIRDRIKAGKKVTIKLVSENLHISTSAVYRLAKRLGYASWSDFIVRMDHYFREKQPQNESGSAASELQASINLMAASLERHIDRPIIIASLGDADVCRDYLIFRLSELGFSAFPFSPELTEAHANPDMPGLALIINETGVALWSACHLCASLGYEVVSITAHQHSPVAKEANLSFAVKDNKSELLEYQPNYFAAGVIAFCERAIAQIRPRLQQQKAQSQSHTK